MTWPTMTLGEICDFSYGSALPEAHRKHGPFPVFGSNGSVGWHNQSLTNGPTLIIGRKGSIGRVHYSSLPCFPIDTTYYIESTKVACDLRWLFYALNTLNLPEMNKAAAVPGLNRNDAYEQKLPLPPLGEQKRIAALLDKADRLRHTRRYAQHLSSSFLQSVFLEMFGDPETNPCRWETVELGDLVQAFEGGTNFNPVPENGPSSTWRVLKISAVTSGEFRPSESKAIAIDTQFDDSLIVRKGDLIISRANTSELVGAVCLVRRTPPKVLLPDKLWRVKLRSDANVNPNYLLHVLQLPQTRQIIGELATGTSGSMKNISKDKAGTIPIMIPSKTQQDTFVDIVLRVERLRAQQREAERQADHLFQTLLHRAFSECD